MINDIAQCFIHGVYQEKCSDVAAGATFVITGLFLSLCAMYLISDLERKEVGNKFSESSVAINVFLSIMIGGVSSPIVLEMIFPVLKFILFHFLSFILVMLGVAVVIGLFALVGWLGYNHSVSGLVARLRSSKKQKSLQTKQEAIALLEKDPHYAHAMKEVETMLIERNGL